MCFNQIKNIFIFNRFVSVGVAVVVSLTLVVLVVGAISTLLSPHAWRGPMEGLVGGPGRPQNDPLSPAKPELEYIVAAFVVSG